MSVFLSRRLASILSDTEFAFFNIQEALIARRKIKKAILTMPDPDSFPEDVKQLILLVDPMFYSDFKTNRGV